MALYNKYRPKKLSQLCGQQHVKCILTSQIKKNELVHAYLFTGPAGTGKTTVARILAAMANCKSGPTVDLPLDDEHVSMILSGKNRAMDVLEIDAATNNGIDEIRSLRDKVEYAPQIMRKKVIIIDECHRLSPQAWEGLLKMLEEPPPYALFILCTTEPDKVTETVKTRCMIFDFHSLATKDVLVYLQKIAGSEKIELEEGALGLLANSSRGSLRLGISRLEKLKHLEGPVTATAVTQIIGIPSGQAARKFLNAVIDKKFMEGLAASSAVVGAGVPVNDFLVSVADLCHDLLLCKGLGLNALGYGPDEAKEVQDLRDKILTLLNNDATGFRNILRKWVHSLNEHVKMCVFNLQPQFQADFSYVELFCLWRKHLKDNPPKIQG